MRSSPGSGGGVDACGPGSPGSRPGGLGPHLTSSGFPRRAFLRLPVCPPGSPLRPPSPGSPSSGVLRFVPFGRCPAPVLLRFPSGFPFPWAISTLAPPRSGSAGVGPHGRDQGHQSCRDLLLDRAMRLHCRSAAAGHDEMPPQDHLIRTPTMDIGPRSLPRRSATRRFGCRPLPGWKPALGHRGR